MSRILVALLLTLAHCVERLSKWLYGAGTALAIRNVVLPPLDAPIPFSLSEPPMSARDTLPEITPPLQSASWPASPVLLTVLQRDGQFMIHPDQWVQRAGRA